MSYWCDDYSLRLQQQRLDAIQVRAEAKIPVRMKKSKGSFSKCEVRQIWGIVCEWVGPTPTRKT